MTTQTDDKRPLMKRLALLSVMALVTLLALARTDGIGAKPQTGTVLADVAPTGAPCPTGNGRGMAFDGTNLYYTRDIGTDYNIYKTDLAGTCLGAIAVNIGFTPTFTGGPLAWDGSALWTMNYTDNSFTLFRVNPANGAIISSCNIATQNPTHPAVTSTPRNIGEYPDGLDWSGSTLWVSSEAYDGNWVAEVDTNCNILTAFNPPANQGPNPYPSFGGTSGVAFDGINLWHATSANNANDWFIFQTDTSGTTTGLSFLVAGRNVEDLAFDPITFAPKCALWGNTSRDSGTGGTLTQLTAYEIPSRGECRPRRQARP